MTFQWQTTPADAFTGLFDSYENYIHQVTKAIADYYAPQIEAWMKSNAKWQDRSGNARQTLWADVTEMVGEMVGIVFDHGMEYGLFLETISAGRWAIITPALDHWSPIIFRAVQEALS